MVQSLHDMEILSDRELCNLGRLNGVNTAFDRCVFILKILEKYSKNCSFPVSGTIDISRDGFGFLRSSHNSYLPSRSDIYVCPELIRNLFLKTGDFIEGVIDSLSFSNGIYPSIADITEVNGTSDLKSRGSIIDFDNLKAEFPTKKIIFEASGSQHDDIICRIIEVIAPIGYGQRAMIVAPPKAGKTSVIRSIARYIEKNNPDITLIVLLIDERPEEVTEMERCIKSEVISSTFDRLPTNHIYISEMVLNKAKRLVETGNNVVILLDGITRLTRAYNTSAPKTGRSLSGGLETNALQKPKKFFGAARNIDGGGSLTIIATTLVDTSSKMDDIIFEEFKGTGNCEICLDRKTADQGIFPAIDVRKSSTRRSELLSTEIEHARTSLLRKMLCAFPNNSDAASALALNMKNTNSNTEFFNKMGNAK